MLRNRFNIAPSELLIMPIIIIMDRIAQGLKKLKGRFISNTPTINIIRKEEMDTKEGILGIKDSNAKAHLNNQ